MGGIKTEDKKMGGGGEQAPICSYLDCGHSCTGVHTCQNLLNYTLHICTAYYMSILPQQGSSKFFLNVKKRSLLFVLGSNSKASVNVENYICLPRLKLLGSFIMGLIFSFEKLSLVTSF